MSTLMGVFGSMKIREYFVGFVGGIVLEIIVRVLYFVPQL